MHFQIMKTFLPAFCLLFVFQSAFAQSQVCPLNNNFSLTNLTHWEAYTGNNVAGNGPSAIKQIYDSTDGAPTGTVGTSVIYEYNLPSTPGIQILNSSSTDRYGSFATVPTINGKIPVLQGQGGNPYLRPYFSTNVDISVEKYFAHDQGKLAFAAYYKAISNFTTAGPLGK